MKIDPGHVGDTAFPCLLHIRHISMPRQDHRQIKLLTSSLARLTGGLFVGRDMAIPHGVDAISYLSTTGPKPCSSTTRANRQSKQMRQCGTY